MENFAHLDDTDPCIMILSTLDDIKVKVLELLEVILKVSKCLTNVKVLKFIS